MIVNVFYRFFKKLEKNLYHSLEIFVSVALVILLFLIACQIISRYFRLQYLAPPDEIIILTYVWMLFIGTALLVRNDDNIKVELLNTFLENNYKLKQIYNIFINILVLIFLFVMMNSNCILYQKSATRTSPMLQLPQRLWYGALIVSGALMVFYVIIQFLMNCYSLLNEPKNKKKIINNLGRRNQ